MLVYCIQSCKTEKNTYINCPEKILNLTSSTYILRYYTSVHTYSGLRSINDCMDKKIGYFYIGYINNAFTLNNINSLI